VSIPSSKIDEKIRSNEGIIFEFLDLSFLSPDGWVIDELVYFSYA